MDEINLPELHNVIKIFKTDISPSRMLRGFFLLGDVLMIYCASFEAINAYLVKSGPEIS